VHGGVIGSVPFGRGSNPPPPDKTPFFAAVGTEPGGDEFS